MARYTPLFYRGAPASIPQVVAHLQKAMSEEDPDYTPLRQRMPPASIPDIVAHIQKYLAENVFVTIDDLGDDIAQYIEDHPEIVGVATVNGSTGNVTLDASDIPIETGEDPTVAGAISYLSSQLALLVADAVLSVNGVDPDDSHDVTLTGAEIPQDGNTMKKLSETFGPATASTAGTKGLVPAPAAGDENKVLSGAGTWVVNQSAGGVSSVCNVEPNAQGNVPLKGSDIPLQSMSLQTVAQAIAAVGNTFTGATSSAAGGKGQVPAPAAGDEDKVLSGGGTWVTPASGTVKQVCSVSPDAQGNVALTGSAVPTSTTDNTPIATSLSNLNDQIVTLGPYNGLDSTSTTAALSAAQGKALNDQIPHTISNLKTSQIFCPPGNIQFTLPSDGCYLFAGQGGQTAINSVVFIIGGYATATRCNVTMLTGTAADKFEIDASNTSALTFTAMNKTDNNLTLNMYKLV